MHQKINSENRCYFLGVIFMDQNVIVQICVTFLGFTFCSKNKDQK
jgi:hypothetical protein